MSDERSGEHGNDEAPMPSEQELVTLTRRKAVRYLQLPGVTSVGVAYRQTTDRETGALTTTDQLCIQFTVDRKLSPESLESQGIPALPKSIPVDDKGEKRVPVQVVERTFEPTYQIVSDVLAEAADARPTPRQKRRSRLDPVVPGTSVCHESGTAGTIGAIVYDKSGKPHLLSNWHVLQGANGSIGDAIVQPGPYDNGDLTANQVGRLARSHLGLAGDCGIATVEHRRFSEEILELDVVPTRAAKAELGDKVVKSGRTTGVTYGIVSRVGVVVNLDYKGSVGVQRIGGFEIHPNPEKLPADGEISATGDSGSVWLVDPDTADDTATADRGSDANVVVGLHFAGEVDPDPAAEHALACNIHSVLQKLEVSLVDTDSPVVTEEDLWNEVFERLRYLETRVGTIERVKSTSREETRQAPPAATAIPEGLRVYGNWCGPGHSGPGKPIDELDRACMHHDKCYSRRGRQECTCDMELLRDIDRALSSGTLSPAALAAGTAIRAWFTVQPCVTWVGGVPIPTGTGQTTRTITWGVRKVKSAWRRLFG